MDRKEYILRLTQSLSKYEVEDEFTFIANYDELIEEILFDNDQDFNAVIDKLGYPEILAQELAQEFNFKLSQEKPTYEYKRKPRRRHNTIWRILKFGAGIVQFFLLISLVILIAYGSFVGSDQKLIIQSQETHLDLPMDGEFGYFTNIVVAFCGTNESDCNGFTYRESMFGDELNICQGQDCINELTDAYYVTLPIMPIIFFSGFMMLMFMLINQFLVIRNLNKVIRSNKEYNRRRNDE